MRDWSQLPCLWTALRPLRKNTASVHFHFPLRNLQPQTFGLIYKFHEDMHGHLKCWQRLKGLRIFYSKNVGEPIEYPRCLPLPCFNKFVLTQKNFNCFVRYKTIPTLLCKERRWCPDEAPMFWSPTYYWSRPMLFEKVEKRRITALHFKASTVDVGECIQPQQHWSKEHSKVVNPQERLLSIIQILAKVFRRLYHLPMK